VKALLYLITFFFISSCMAQTNDQEIFFKLDSPDGLELINVEAESVILNTKQE